MTTLLNELKGMRPRQIGEYVVAGVVAGLILRGFKHELAAHSASKRAKLRPIKATGPRDHGD